MNLNRELNERFEHLIKLMRALHHGRGQNTRGYAQERALRAIAAQEGIAQRELMEQLDVRPSSMSELLTKLENGNLIERRSHPSDRRQIQLYLSREGRAQPALPSDDAPLPDPFDVLSDEEQQQYLSMTNRIIDALTRVCEARGISADRPPCHRGGRDGRRDHHREDFQGGRDGRSHRDSDFYRPDVDADEEIRASCDPHAALRGGRGHGRHRDDPDCPANPGAPRANRKSGRGRPESLPQNTGAQPGICGGCGKGCKLTSPDCGRGARLAQERGIQPKN